MTYHNDVNRTGWNPAETVLTTANVSASTFGLLQTVNVDGRIDAQPLVVPSIPIAGQGTHDVVYVATENDSVYAIDAYTGTVLAQRNLGVAVLDTYKNTADDTVFPTYGILGTPVIDPATFAMYLVTDTNEGKNSPDVYRLHMLSLYDLSDLVPSVVLMTTAMTTPPTSGYPTATLSDGSTFQFSSQHQRQRPALLDTNGTIYVAFGGMDPHPLVTRGLIEGFSTTNLAPLLFNVITNRLPAVKNGFDLTSIWQSGYGPAADARGSIFFATGNASPVTPSYNSLYSFPESVLKLSGDLSTIQSSFTQYNYFFRDVGDGDLGSGGTMVIPDQPGVYPHLVIAGGKPGRAYLLNADSLGGFTPGGPNSDLGEFTIGPCWCGPAYFVGSDLIPRIVTGGGNGVATWRLTDGPALALTLEGQVSHTLTNGLPDHGGTIPAISSNGTAPGSAILWYVQRPLETTTYTMYLHAFDASNLKNQLFVAPAGNWTNDNSNANAVPTVANGYVYVGSYTKLEIFGLLGTTPAARRHYH